MASETISIPHLLPSRIRLFRKRAGDCIPAAIIIGALCFSAGCGSTPDPQAEQITGESSFSEREDLSREEPMPAPGILAADEDTDSYLINPHDLIDISVLGESDLSLSVRVSERGTISFPLLGEVSAAGLTTIQFERRLEERLGRDYLVSPSVNVAIKEFGTISVLGQVQKPGSFEIKGQLTVSRAIALAGGLTKTASPNGTRIIRKYGGREEIIPVRLNDIFKGGDLRHDIPLRPGDLVVVPESFF